MPEERTGKRCIKCGEGEVVISRGPVAKPSGEAPDLFVAGETPSFTQVEVEGAACSRCGQPYADTSTLPPFACSNQIVMGSAAA